MANDTAAGSCDGKMAAVPVDQILKVPFEHGWKRELVFRQNKKKSDVYYYSPDNIKFRSSVQIEELLKSHPSYNSYLTIDNFTFTTKFIGINDETMEFSRNAVPKKKSFSDTKEKILPSQPSDNVLLDGVNNEPLCMESINCNNDVAISPVSGELETADENKPLTVSLDLASYIEVIDQNGEIEVVEENYKIASTAVQKHKPKRSKVSFKRKFEAVNENDQFDTKTAPEYSPVYSKAIPTKRKLKSVDKNQRNMLSAVLKSVSEELEDIQFDTTTSDFVTSTPCHKVKTSSKEKRKIKTNKATLKNSSFVLTTFEFMTKSMTIVFKYLKVRDLLSASRVSSSWNSIAMKNLLWENVCLKDSMVCDWSKCIDTIQRKNSHSLDTRNMMVPTELNASTYFWTTFSKEIKRASQLKVIELHECPPFVIECIISALPQLTVLNATSIKNYTEHLKPIILHANDLGKMENLTELRLHSLNGIQFISCGASFLSLTRLKTLSITSMKEFAKDLHIVLETVNTNLETLEIGDCEGLAKRFPSTLKKFSNLKLLRFENGFDGFIKIDLEVFDAIKHLKVLSKLELINIKFTKDISNILKTCVSIKEIMLIPDYTYQPAITNFYVVDCLKQLSATLTHVVWVFTHEMLKKTDSLLIVQEEFVLPNKNDVNPRSRVFDRIPIIRSTNKLKMIGESQSLADMDDMEDKFSIDFILIKKLEDVLSNNLKNANVKIVTVPFSMIPRVNLKNYFNHL